MVIVLRSCGTNTKPAWYRPGLAKDQREALAEYFRNQELEPSFRDMMRLALRGLSVEI